MSQKYCLLATEGRHDQAAIARLLQLSGLKRFNGGLRHLDPFWERLFMCLPKLKEETFEPHSEDDSFAPMTRPLLMTSATHSIAIYAGGGTSLVPYLNLIAKRYKPYAKDIHAFGLIIDTDNEPPQKVAKEKAESLRDSFPSLSAIPGVVTPGTPRTGIYILPDNKRSGALDSILVECASVVYPDHKKGAIQFIDELDTKHTKHLKFTKKEKAIVACIVSVLQPGSTNTLSIEAEKWISDQTIDHKDVASLYQFLKDLLELPS